MNGPIAAIDAGMSYHTRTLREPPFSHYFQHLIDVRLLGDTDLSAFPVLLIPCRTNGARLAAHRARLADYVEQGGFLVVLGETRPDLFLDGIGFSSVRTNFWWWLDRTADLGVQVSAPDHGLFRHLDEADLVWHVHGTLDVPAGGRSLVDWCPDGNPCGSLMIEQDRGHGRLLVTTLDPVYHHGSGFMPATTRFLDGFLRWLSVEAVAVALASRQREALSRVS